MGPSNCRPIFLFPLITKLENSINVNFYTSSPSVLCSTHSTRALAPSWHWNLFKVTSDLHFTKSLISFQMSGYLISQQYFLLLIILFSKYFPHLASRITLLFWFALTSLATLSLLYSLLIIFPSLKFVVPRDQFLDLFFLPPPLSPSLFSVYPILPSFLILTFSSYPIL